MRLITVSSLVFVAALSSTAASQAKPTAEKQAKPPKAKLDSGVLAKFFQGDTPIAMTLTANIGKLRGDKKAETAPWRDATLEYTADTAHGTIPIKVKTRGIWRLNNCQFPPVRLNFPGEATKHTIFHGLDKPKLTNHCRNDDTYEQYVLQEFQLYRIYRMLTPTGHTARLVRMTYMDSANPKPLATRYAFIQEEPTAVAERLGAKQSKLKGAGPKDLEPFQSGLVGVFEYMIGNTDFAMSALHNIELYQMPNGDYIPVAYDFDFSGAVNSRYATADPRLHIRNVRERLYRGFCVPNETYPQIFALFNAKKDSIYALYRDPIGKLLKQNIVDETLEYFDDFYKVINEPRSAKMRIIDECKK